MTVSTRVLITQVRLGHGSGYTHGLPRSPLLSNAQLFLAGYRNDLVQPRFTQRTCYNTCLCHYA
jgi:hypothetical protein